MDEAARRAEAGRLRQRLAQLQKQRDQQDLEITRLRESNRKQQSVIQAKDDLLRSYKHGQGGAAASSPISSSSSAAAAASFSPVGDGAADNSPPTQPAAAAATAAARTPVGDPPPSSAADAVAWFERGVNLVASQLAAQRVLDARVEELRKAVQSQETKTDERRRVVALVAARGRVGLDQTVRTLDRNVALLKEEADAVAAEEAKVGAVLCSACV